MALGRPGCQDGVTSVNTRSQTARPASWVLVLAHCRRHTAAGPLPPAALNVTLTV